MADSLRVEHDGKRITLRNDAIRVDLDAGTGAVLQVENRPRGLRLMRHPVTRVPWRVERGPEGGPPAWTDAFDTFDWAEDAAGLRLSWATADGLAVEAGVELPESGASLAFTVAVQGAPGIVIDKIEYPILTGIGDLHDAAESLLVHPQGTGFLFRRPYHLFEPESPRRQGLRHAPYPEGFNGATMQFMAYYAEGEGGFLFQALDPANGMKWLNFSRGEPGALAATFMHQAEDMRPGAGLEVPYPVTVEPLVEGTWYEAAERYKAWAVDQSWTAQGPLATRDDRATWLLDEVGFATFGVNAAHDRTAWLDRFHAITDEPVFHVLGVNWPKVETGYGRGHPGGRDDWFPARFSTENLATIRENGDYWAPFEFDLLLDPDKAESEQVRANRLKLPEEKFSFDQYRFPFQCPATDYLPALHAWRDAELAGTYGADALYYDISANNVLMTCRDPDHGHPVGGGSWMVDAFRRMWEATGEAASAAKGRHVPQGAEMISEAFIPQLDYYQARAEASPLSAFEADFFRDWIRAGQVEKIPLFTYVYHEYGPVRLDGWGKLSRETGELWYWVAARVAAWGGLYELNYEFSDLEALEGFDDDPAQHYVDYARRAYAVDPDKVAFVRDIARARTGFARPWLVYGTMLRPLPFDCPEIELDYLLYNVARHRPTYEEAGTMRVGSVVHAAWRAPDGHPGFVFINLRGDGPQTVTIALDAARYGIPEGARYTVREYTHAGATERWTGTGPAAIELTLEPRTVTLLEVVPDVPAGADPGKSAGEPIAS